MNKGLICRRCKKEIPPGGIFFKVILTVVSGFDGVLNPDESHDVDGILGLIEDVEAEQLERGVYFEEEVLLCAECKEDVTASFLNELERKDSIYQGGPEGRLH